MPETAINENGHTLFDEEKIWTALNICGIAPPAPQTTPNEVRGYPHFGRSILPGSYPRHVIRALNRAERIVSFDRPVVHRIAFV